MTEADTCCKFVVPLLQKAGWDNWPNAALISTPPAGLDEASARRRMLTGRHRADRMKRQQVAFFTYYAPEAREILNDLFEKYAIDGEIRFTLPDVLKAAPIWRHGNVAEICRTFGGVEQLRDAVNQLRSLLYAA